jgi:hypothetical protein
MDNREQIKAFDEALQKLINRFAREFNLTYAELVGVMEIAKAKLIDNANRK